MRFCGGTHSNLNLPIWHGDALPIAGLLAEVAALRRVDLFALMDQPQYWQGTQNPFAALLHQPSPDDVYSGSLDPDGRPFTQRLPSGMRKKERKLMRLEGFRYAMAATADETQQVLAAFLAQNAARFARQGIRNVFAEPGVTDFIRAACFDGLAAGRPVIELHALMGAGDVLAIVGGVSNAQRFSAMFNSITDTALARLSPGIVLMSRIVGDCARRGIASFDLGAGLAPYKSHFSSEPEQRFDCFIPFSARGRLLGAAYSGSRALRHSLKATPALMNALQMMRRWTSPGRALE